MNNKIKIICVVGPTASGKTDIAVKLAKCFGGEIVSADSMQIYKNMSIASAAPTMEEKGGIPHYMLEFLDGKKSYTVAQYVKAARDFISDISKRNKLPIIAGGTGLYINSLVDNIEFCEQETDLSIRKRLEKEADNLSSEQLLKRLETVDPETASRLHENDRRRIIRALEIYETSGITISKQNELSRKNESPYEPIMIGLTCLDRQKLYDRINRRVDKMLENGLVNEARATFDNLRTSGGGAVQAIGHKELFGYFNGEKSLEECVENLKRATRRYAKRQLTWFRKDERIQWIYTDVENSVADTAIKIVKEALL